MRISPVDALGMAGGRTLLVGEHHTDRAARDAMLALMRDAPRFGYAALGVEVSLGGTGKWWGLADELKYVNRLAGTALTEHDRRSYIDRPFWRRKQRVNRHWMIQLALTQRWAILAIDPCHWHWERDGHEGYFGDRETLMAEAIRGAIGAHGPMLVNCGALHLAGLREALGDAVACVTATSMDALKPYKDPVFNSRLTAVRSVPLLVTDR